MKNTFLEKLFTKIDRVSQGELAAYLQRLSSDKGFFETIFNTLQEAILVIDPRGVIRYLNHAATTLLGIDNKGLGVPIAHYLKIDWPTILSQAGVVTRDLEVIYPQARFLNFYSVPLESRSKEPMGFAIIFHDLTATRARTEEAIQSERLSALTLLAAGVAHELGNPLNSLNIHLQLLERDLRRIGVANEKPELVESLQIARSEVGRLDTILKQFLGAIRPGRMVREPVQINVVVSESLAFLKPEIRDRDVLVEEELEQGLPFISANPDELKMAFYNIIKNAVQAMPQGGILRVKTTLVEDFLSIAFEDNGSGITPEDMAHITEPYFTRKKSGTGLGLFTVQRVIHGHGGQVELQSEPGRGTTVRILLPLAERRVRMLPAGGEANNDDAVEVPTAEADVVVETIPVASPPPVVKPKSTKRPSKRNERAER